MLRLSDISMGGHRDLAALAVASAIAVAGVAVLNHLAHASASPTSTAHSAVKTASLNSAVTPDNENSSSSSNEELFSSSSSQSSSNNQTNSKTTVTVNGEDIPVPQNGSFSKTIRNGNTTTQISGNTTESGQVSNNYSYSSTITTDSSSPSVTQESDSL